MYRLLLICLLGLAIGSSMVFQSCQHEPYLVLIDNPNDSTGTGGQDTTGNSDTTIATIACDPDTVYFRNTILPILVSNCSMSGCHNETSRQDGVILTSYDRIMATGEIDRQRPTRSELYEVLVEDDADDRMPRGKAPLPDEQIAMILRWIEQGAKDNYCDECDSTQASYALNIKPIIVNSCQGCHSGTAPSGGHNFTTYEGLKAVASSGRLLGAVSHTPGYTAMPLNGKLPDCDVSKIREWIRNGARNN